LGDRLPSISATESLVLDLLEHQERYGLELIDASGGTLKRGSVYVTLGRMEAKGFVTSRQAPSACLDACIAPRRTASRFATPITCFARRWR
jgi:hypothetical protein